MNPNYSANRVLIWCLIEDLCCDDFYYLLNLKQCDLLIVKPWHLLTKHRRTQWPCPPFCRNNIALFSCEITSCWKFVTSITAPLFQWSVSDIVSPWSTSSPNTFFGMWAIGWLLFHESWRCKFYLNHFLCMLALFCLALFSALSSNPNKVFVYSELWGFIKFHWTLKAT